MVYVITERILPTKECEPKERILSTKECEPLDENLTDTDKKIPLKL